MFKIIIPDFTLCLVKSYYYFKLNHQVKTLLIRSMSMSDTNPQTIVKMSEGGENHISYWANRYIENKIGWHMNEVNPILIKSVHHLIGNSTSLAPASKSIFVPLCGKSKDIAYLLSLGFRVFAIEGVQQAILELDADSGFGLRLDTEDSVYQTEDGMLKIYFGDMFQCPVEKWGPFDCVWDRGAFIAMEYPSRRKYVEVMKRSLKDSNQKYINFWYLLETVNYDKSLWPDSAPPRAVDAKDMEEYYDDWTTTTEILENSLMPETSGVRKALNLGPAYCIVYLLVPKIVNLN